MSTTNNWFARLTSGAASWAERDAYNTVVESTLSCTWQLLSTVTSDSPAFAYAINADIGVISGNIELPFGSPVERDLYALYQLLYYSAQSDLVPSYTVRNYADNTRYVEYDVYLSATRDLSPYYGLGGTTEVDLLQRYDLHNSAEQDLADVTYDVIEGVEQDLVTEYVLNTDPWTAAIEQNVTYNVLRSAEKEFAFVYRVYNGAERDLTDTYTIKLGAQADLSPTFDLNSTSWQDSQFVYDVLSPVYIYSSKTVAYNIVSKTKRVPNVIGYPLPKAQKMIEDAGLVLGTVTYQ